MAVLLPVLALAWLLGWVLCWRLRTVPYAPDLKLALRPPSVVIPAHDEDGPLATVLTGIAAQTSSVAEVIVVDECSEDTAAAVATARGARVLPGEDPPPGWTDKTWALFRGVRAARADVVVCLDADVDPSSHLVARLGRCFADRGGLVSVQPYHEMRHVWERAAAFFNLAAVMGVGLAAPGPSRTRERAAFGPCLIARRDALLTHLAHRSVRHSAVEDVALARRFAAADAPVTCFGGGDLVAYRMYDRPGRLLEGFTRSSAAGAATTPWLRLLAIAAWIAAGILAAVAIIGGGPVALLVYAAFAVQCYVMLRQLGNFGILAALLYPVLAVFFLLVSLGSLVLALRGHVPWKGRTVRPPPADG